MLASTIGNPVSPRFHAATRCGSCWSRLNSSYTGFTARSSHPGQSSNFCVYGVPEQPGDVHRLPAPVRRSLVDVAVDLADRQAAEPQVRREAARLLAGVERRHHVQHRHPTVEAIERLVERGGGQRRPVERDEHVRHCHGCSCVPAHISTVIARGTVAMRATASVAYSPVSIGAPTRLPHSVHEPS